ncbi:MAG: hypothetical protein JXR97_07935, partial [Planctomycetes bacterium]|nr:hypothetical protein [Planctomycetota bacterium]
KNWDRERWILSALNLFEPDWTASLVRINETIDARDIYDESDIAGGTEEGTSYLFRMINQNAVWRTGVQEARGWSNSDKKAEKAWRNMKSPPMQGDNTKRIDWNNRNTTEEIGDVVQH